MSFAPFLAPERDERHVMGRPKAAALSPYVVPGLNAFSIATQVLTANTDHYSPWFTSTPIVVDQIAAEVTTGAGTNYRIGFYRADRNWQPIGAPLADSGNLGSTAAGVDTYTPGTAIYLPRGRYLSVVNADAAPTLRAVRGTVVTAIDSAIGGSAFYASLTVARAYAAFPTPGTAWDTGVASSTSPTSQMVFYRVTTP